YRRVAAQVKLRLRLLAAVTAVAELLEKRLHVLVEALLERVGLGCILRVGRGLTPDDAADGKDKGKQAEARGSLEHDEPSGTGGKAMLPSYAASAERPRFHRPVTKSNP